MSLEGLVGPQNSLAGEPQALCETVRWFVVGMDQKEQPLHAVVERPVSNQAKSTRRDAVPASGRRHPVVRLSAPQVLVDGHPHLAENPIIGRVHDGEPGLPMRPPLVGPLDPLPSVDLGEALLHEREPNDVGIGARSCDIGGVTDTERAQHDPAGTERRIRRTPTHAASLAERWAAGSPHLNHLPAFGDTRSAGRKVGDASRVSGRCWWSRGRDGRRKWTRSSGASVRRAWGVVPARGARP